MEQQTLPRTAIKLRLLLLAFFSVTVVHSQWSNDPTVNTPVSTPSYNQSRPRLCGDGSGGTIITWEDARSGSSVDIYAQRLNAAGVPQWALDGVAICTANDLQSDPELVSDGVGGAIITWRDSRSGSDIYAQRVNSSGVVQWAANGVAICAAAGYQGFPQLTNDGTGGAIITWEDYRVANYDIYAQRVNSSGTVQWATDGVAICTTTESQFGPQLTSDGLSGAIITWWSGTAFYAQRVNSSGVAQWAANGVVFTTMTNYHWPPRLASDGLGGAIIVLESSDDIFAQRLNSSGVSQWTANGVAICTATSSQERSQLVSDGAGGAIIAWQDMRSASISDMDIYAQRLNAAGVPQWATDGVAICAATKSQQSPQLVSDGSGGAIITWADYRVLYSYIYAQRVNSSGVTQWTTNGEAICTATNYPYSQPQLTSNGSGGAIITWHEGRNVTRTDIYAQNINRNGQLGYPTTLVNGAFEQGLTAWSAGGCATPSIVVYGCNSANAAKISITGANCNAQFYQHGFAIERGKRYRVSFNAWSSRGEDMQLTILPHNASTPNLGLDRRVDLGTGSCRSFSFDFTATGSTTDARLRFSFNYMSTTGYWYMFDNVSVEPSVGKEAIAEGAAPTSYVLEQSFPNPFNPTTTINFALPEPSYVSLTVFDVLGRKIAELENGVKEAGYHSATWNASDAASGVYFARFTAVDVNGKLKLSKVNRLLLTK